jgi:hypothetical protein
MKVAATVLALLALAGAAGGAGTSGLRGTVVRSPIRPVCVIGEPCSAPASNTAIVFARAGRRTVTTRTDARGRYRVVLAPGVWTVRTSGVPRLGTGISPKSVRVYAGRFKVVDFDVDTGIR